MNLKLLLVFFLIFLHGCFCIRTFRPLRADNIRANPFYKPPVPSPDPLESKPDTPRQPTIKKIKSIDFVQQTASPTQWNDWEKKPMEENQYNDQKRKKENKENSNNQRRTEKNEEIVNNQRRRATEKELWNGWGATASYQKDRNDWGAMTWYQKDRNDWRATIWYQKDRNDRGATTAGQREWNNGRLARAEENQSNVFKESKTKENPLTVVKPSTAVGAELNPPKPMEIIEANTKTPGTKEELEIKEHNSRVFSMMATVFNRKEKPTVKVPILFSPLSMYTTLGLVSTLVDEKSDTLTELNKCLNVEEERLTASSFHTWNTYWNEKNDILSVNVFLSSVEESKKTDILKTMLKDSDTELKSTQQELNNFVNKKTNGEIKELTVKGFPEAQALINIVNLKFGWKHIARDGYIEGKFKYWDGGYEREKDIKYFHQTALSKYKKEENEYVAVSLPLLNPNEGKPQGIDTYNKHASISAYVILLEEAKKDALIHELWPTIHKQLKSQSLAEFNIQLPTFKLENEYEVPKETFPLLLSGKNVDFSESLLIDKVKIKIVQKNILCVDRKAIGATSVTLVEIRRKTTPPMIPGLIEVNRPFYFVLANTETGVPLFFAYVNDVHEGGKEICEGRTQVPGS